MFLGIPKINSYSPKGRIQTLSKIQNRSTLNTHTNIHSTIPCFHFSKSCNFGVRPQTATSTDHLATFIVTNSTLSLPGAWFFRCLVQWWMAKLENSFIIVLFLVCSIVWRWYIGAPDRASPGILAAILKGARQFKRCSGCCNNIPKSCDALPACSAVYEGVAVVLKMNENKR